MLLVGVDVIDESPGNFDVGDADRESRIQTEMLARVLVDREGDVEAAELLDGRDEGVLGAPDFVFGDFEGEEGIVSALDSAYNCIFKNNIDKQFLEC